MSDGPIVSIVQTGQVPGITGGPNVTNAAAGATQLYLNQAGGLIRGEVTGRDANGNTLLKTDNGTVAIKSDYYLKYGSEVVIRLDTNAAALRARIVSIDGQPPQLATNLAGIPTNLETIQDPVRTTGKFTETFAPQPQSLPSIAAALLTEDTAPDAPLLKAVLITRAPTAQAMLTNIPAASGFPAHQFTPGSEITLKIANANTLQQPSASGNTALPATTPGGTLSNTAPGTGGNAPPVQSSTSSNIALLMREQLQQPQKHFGNAPAAASIATTQRQPLGNPQTTTPTAQTPTPAAPSLSSSQLPNATFGATPTPPVPETAATAGRPQTSVQVPTQQTANALAQGLPTLTSAAPRQELVNQTLSLMPGQMLGNVLGQERPGEVLIQTPLGIIKLPLGALGGSPALPGTQLLFNITGMKPSPMLMQAMTPMQSSGPLMPLADLSSSWPSLQQLYSLIQSQAPQLMNDLQQKLPQSGERLASSLLFFASILTSGDVGKWLGQRITSTVEQLGRGDILKKMGSEFTMLSKAFAEPPPGNWQMLYFPLMHGGELQQVRMYLKRDGNKKDGDAKKQASTRFVIEVGLSALGDMQLDGFVKQIENKMVFDLIVRTLQPLEKEDEQAILGIYNQAAQMTGFIGNLGFQNVREFPVKPLEDLAADRHSAIVA